MKFPVSLGFSGQAAGVSLEQLPPGVSVDDGASKLNVGDTETAGSIVLKAEANAAPVSNWPVRIIARVASAGAGHLDFASAQAMLTVNKPPAPVANPAVKPVR